MKIKYYDIRINIMIMTYLLIIKGVEKNKMWIFLEKAFLKRIKNFNFLINMNKLYRCLYLLKYYLQRKKIYIYKSKSQWKSLYLKEKNYSKNGNYKDIFSFYYFLIYKKFS